MLKFIKMFFLIIFGLFALCFIIGVIGFRNAKPTVIDIDIENVIDGDSFSRISKEELIEKMGETSTVEEWEGKIILSYSKNDIIYEFFLYDNKVVRLNVMPVVEPFQFGRESDIFEIVGINMGEDIKRVTETGYSLKYHLVNHKVAELFVPVVGEGNTFDLIKITYDFRPFGL